MFASRWFLCYRCVRFLRTITNAHSAHYYYNNALCKEQRDYHLVGCGRWAPKVIKGLIESFAGKTFEVFTRFTRVGGGGGGLQ